MLSKYPTLLNRLAPRKNFANYNKSRNNTSSSPPPPNVKSAKTRAGTGHIDGSNGKGSMSMMFRGPVSWAGLGVVAVAAASAVSYYQVERERRLEQAMGKIVSTGKPAIGGEWSLVDLDGNLVTNKTF